MDKTKVLLADSDMKRAAALAAQLQQKGVEVFSTNDAVHTMGMARKTKPDLILLSGQLAGGGGLAALRRIRSNVFTANIPVVGLVGTTGSQEHELVGAGAQSCLRMPVDAAALQAAIGAHQLQSLDFTLAPAAVLAEPARMEAVQETRLLDSPPERAFDRITHLAARLIDAPTALVTLVDKDRQFFKSQVGLAQPWAGERQTRLSHSFCQWVVAGKEPVVIRDANEHPALRKNLAIRDLGVIAYAGVPIHGRGGEAIGSMCTIDSQARTWTDEDVATLEDLRQIVEAYAVLDRAKRGGRKEGSLDLSLHVAGNAILGATRLLRRYGKRMADAERVELLAIIEEQAQHLVDLAPKP